MNLGNPRSLSVNIPFDIIADQILPRLPVKSLIKFTSVCKKWQGFIKSPQFIQAHIHHNRFEAKEGNLEYPLIYDQESVYVLDQNHRPVFFSKLDFPSIIHESSSYERIVIESCNGLVLVKRFVNRGYRRQEVFLWNPSIKKIKLICSQPEVDFGPQVFGLGFDESSNQHKVVKIMFDTKIKKCNIITTVEVYNSSSDSWHKIDSKPPHQTFSSSKVGVYLNGCIHWLVNYFDVYSIIMFDFESESFRQMAAPLEVFDRYCYDLKEFEGSLAIIYFSLENEDEDDAYNEYAVYLWNVIHMTEYGVHESWTKILSVTARGEDGLPVSFTKDGKLVYTDWVSGTRYLNFMDVRNQQSEFIEGFGKMAIAINYMESLALLC